MSAEYFASAGAPGTATSTTAASRWLTEEVFTLIEIVQRDEAIYNPRHKYYFCRPYVENFWREVDLKLEKNPGASLAKWTNLRISFRREYTNFLEEKVPPCWTYFDRMFFLHPYLRKKQQQPKSLDSQVQDALVTISSLSSRLQRVTAASAAASLAVGNSSGHGHMQPTQPHQPLDNYLEYLDEAEQHTAELDEIIDDERHARFQNMEAHSMNNEIKSECEDDFDAEVRNEPDESDQPDGEVDADESEMRRFMLDSLATNAADVRHHQLHTHHQHSHNHTQQQQQQRLQHLNRLQKRSYHEDLRAKRPRSQETISSTQRILCSATPTHSNVSFVRPTFAKPIDIVSTTNSISANASSSTSITNNNCEDAELNDAGGTLATVASTSPAVLNPHHHHHPPTRHHHHRLEISSIQSGSASTAAATAVGKMFSESVVAAAPTSGHVELCECKTDSDAMFLMSLLPDIQKLNGRDRGKIKIAFQNILQDYLYPD